MYNKKKFFALLIVVVLMFSMFQTSFCAASAPTVKVINVNSNSPQIPDGLKTVGDTMPVLELNGMTYWAYSYNDNRVGMCIVAYDSQGNIVNKWEKTGDRNLTSIYVDKDSQKVYFRGQYYDGGWSVKGIEMNLSELITIKNYSTSKKQQIPNGLKIVGDTVPVLEVNGLTYWAYSYDDNRVGMCIVAYDSQGNVVNKWEKTGDRYLTSIDVDNYSQKVYFRGQYYDGGWSVKGIEMNLNELITIKNISMSSQPQIPNGLKIVGNTMPVLEYNGITYWAFSYNDNRVGMCIVGYDSQGDIVNKWEKTGDRYLTSINVDQSSQKVYFRGQYYDGGWSVNGIEMNLSDF